MATITENLAAVKERIARAARIAGRDPDSVRLVAVTKQVPAEIVREVANAPGIVFGENKVQEALAKIEELRALNCRWHFIGHLQKNKAKFIPGRFDLVHSVDDAELGRKLDEHSRHHNVTTQILVQVNVSGEVSKFGIAPHRLEELLVELSRYSGLAVQGLMTIPPFDPDPENSRIYFARLRELRDQMETRAIDNISLRELSMGMSHDFEVAIEEGATWVRVGTAIFGPRQ